MKPRPHVRLNTLHWAVDIYSISSYIVLCIMFGFVFTRRVATMTEGIRGF